MFSSSIGTEKESFNLVKVAFYETNAHPTFSLEVAQKVKDRFEQRGTLLGEDSKITPEMVYDILKNC